ncbi:hypothetical protein BGZ61DRAFT_40095 [Ilyonectria robusta]|uniref:uncharacterized protein n=1 Tax=Ilyonectria robusta TaxID=1079257 RepID=UPI001E8D0033|nr:uncharacterized protein BGZ61DRAFT_40095 [Ilyonectria robusta]KAH8688200.1 hypothetical protein BGZ61DRAFT_40095 [Ilyonectria robusta]
MVASTRFAPHGRTQDRAWHTFVHTDQREQPKKASPRNQDKAIWPGGVGPGHGPALVGAELELHRNTLLPPHSSSPPPTDEAPNLGRLERCQTATRSLSCSLTLWSSPTCFPLSSLLTHAPSQVPTRFGALREQSRQTWDRRRALFGSTNCGGAVSPSHSTVQPPKRTYCTVSAKPQKTHPRP